MVNVCCTFCCVGMIQVYYFWSFKNVSLSQNFTIRISFVKTVPKCLRKLKVFFNYDIDVSSLLMSSLRAMVIWQKYFGNYVISSQFHLFALNMRCCTP